MLNVDILKVIPIAEETDVKIAIENDWNNFIIKPAQVVAYLDEINIPHVGWLFDTANAIKFSPPETWIPVIGKRVLKLLIKGYSKAKCFVVKLFEGENDWPASMKALADAGYQGWGISWGISEQPGAQTNGAASLRDFSARRDQIFIS